MSDDLSRTESALLDELADRDVEIDRLNAEVFRLQLGAATRTVEVAEILANRDALHAEINWLLGVGDAMTVRHAELLDAGNWLCRELNAMPACEAVHNWIELTNQGDTNE